MPVGVPSLRRSSHTFSSLLAFVGPCGRSANQDFCGSPGARYACKAYQIFLACKPCQSPTS